VRLQPWLNAVPDRFMPDRARLNPLAWETPATLDKLFFRPYNALTPSEVDDLRARRWLAPDGPPLPDYQRGVATYPQVYYWSVHLIAEPIIGAFGLRPWDATFVYRLATCAIAAALWGLAWAAARRAGLPLDVSAWLFAFVLLTPMLAFISSAVNPDAVAAPLGALAVIAAWGVLTTGRGAGTLAAALLAAALTKPAGLQLAAVLIVVAAILAVLRVVERRAAAVVAGTAIGVVAAAFALFYLWQPSRFLATGPSNDTLPQYVVRRWETIADLWRSYWGQLGWLDYGAPVGWHWLLLALLVVNVGCLIWKPRRPAQLAIYLGAVWIVFVGSTFAAEIRYLREAGYTFQGRYLLPASLGLGAVLLHEVKAARIAMLAGILALNLLLMRETVRRYYGNGWSGAVHALPFR
jgi:hypothetical protein